MDFKVVGPVRLKRVGKTIPRDIFKRFKADIRNKKHLSLNEACGCYVFCTLTSGGGVKPWYVGLANAMPLLQEALSPHKVGIYTEVLQKTEKGIPALFFLPKVKANGNFANPSKPKKGSVNFLELWLIASALQKNQNLINTKNTKHLRKLHVTGLFNPKKGEATLGSSALSKALGL